MKKRIFNKKINLVLLVLISSLSSLNILLAQSSKEGNKKAKIVFACPPCGCDGDTKYSDKPGLCSDCGATMYPILEGVKNENNNIPIQKNVAILVFPGVELIDYTGPWEVLGAAGMNVYSVAKNDSIISCFPGLKIKPDYTFKDCPKPDILLIPGGNVNPDDTETVSWIKDITIQTEHTVSVCTGAYYLGATGLLDNTKATTFYEAVNDFKKNFPKVNIVDNSRFVDNGKIITAAGLSSGIDLAFHIVSIYNGDAETKKLANLLEYNWDSKKQYVRGKLSDKFLVNFVRLFSPFNTELTEYNGDESQWKLSVKLKTDVALEDILHLIDYQATVLNHWENPSKNNYTFRADGKTWNCSVNTEKTIGKEYLIHFEIN